MPHTKTPITRLIIRAAIVFLGIGAAGGGSVWWYLAGIKQPLIADRLKTVPADSGSTASDPISTLVNIVPNHEVILFGEEHGNFLQAQRFAELLKAIEAISPGRIGLVGLEVFSRYQDSIDKFLQSGDEQLLRNSPDEEMLRGHKGETEITKNFLDIYRTIRSINGQRKNSTPIRIIAMDSAPSDTSFRTWWHAAGKFDRLRWVVGRDQAMAERVERTFLDVKSGGKIATIFVGSAHIQRSGSVVLGIPPATVEVEWLGARLAKKFNLLAINQNDPQNDCEDVIEAWLSSRRAEGTGLPHLKSYKIIWLLV